MKAIQNKSLWSWLGISMAGWNAIISLLGALAILWLSLRKPKAA